MNEDRYLPYASLFLRLALAFTLLAAVADSVGFWGDPGDKHVLWGDWFSFETYINSLIPFISRGITDKLASVIAVLEVCFALMLLFGLKIRWAAIGTGILYLMFAILITVSLGLKASLNGIAIVGSAASFLLAGIPIYKWTLNGIKKKTVYRPY